VKLTQADENPEQLLLDGKIDALISPNVPPSFRAGDPRIRRLFPRCRETVEDYFAKTRIFPITHTVVVREDLLVKEPWIARRLADAFADADRICRREYNYPKRLLFPTAVLVLEEEERKFGEDPWAHGLEPNRHNLDKFMEYAASQRYTGRRLSLEEAFWPASAGGATAKDAIPTLVGAA
jgi:4,5-dihydroxyphthalate decarboxylase